MGSVIAQIHALVQSADEAGRLNIKTALRQVQAELQSPKDVMMELANSNLLVAAVRILIDEIVLPDTDAPWEATMVDLAMMITCVGKGALEAAVVVVG